ncbi:hypothetical protein KIN20_006734 [Parelaphostrongylus tenuis]|uniref:Uncharacterized protein n=1 Tax=Parelaphostrongylus tenuis TaxID=148309 RepID=A0AAD5MNH1_PARTN|nr:hypothetical protein KIN20_006734 [Parelaphostrongylus tenuis]
MEHGHTFVVHIPWAMSLTQRRKSMEPSAVTDGWNERAECEDVNHMRPVANDDDHIEDVE